MKVYGEALKDALRGEAELLSKAFDEFVEAIGELDNEAEGRAWRLRPEDRLADLGRDLVGLMNMVLTTMAYSRKVFEGFITVCNVLKVQKAMKKG
jgi:hypothetical protein